MWNLVRNDRGGALVTALFFITGLTAIATIIVFVTGSERRVAHNEYTHTRAFNASDAGAEEAINFIRVMADAPMDNPGTKILDQTGFTTLYDPSAYTTELNQYMYDVSFDAMTNAPGWNANEFANFDFTIEAEGASAKESSSIIEVEASRLFPTGY
jgi:Tfp pilus assembly protein PilX